MHWLQIIGSLITALTIVYLWVEWVGGFFANRRRRRGATRFVHDYQQLLNLPHEYAPIHPADAQHYQLDAFDMARDELARDFGHLADLENLTHSRVYNTRTFCRFLVSHDGHTLAYCHQELIPGRAEEAVFVDYMSWLDTGDIMETSIALSSDKAIKHPKWLIKDEPMRTDPWALANIHRNRLRDHLHENPGVQVKPIQHIDTLIEFLSARDRLIKEIVDQRDVMIEQLNEAGADPRFIEAVSKQRSA